MKKPITNQSDRKLVFWIFVVPLVSLILYAALDARLTHTEDQIRALVEHTDIYVPQGTKCPNDYSDIGWRMYSSQHRETWCRLSQFIDL